MKELVFVLGIFIVLAACTPMQNHKENYQTSTASNFDTLKALEIDGEQYTNYTKWVCRDYVHDENIALEVVKTDKGVGDLMGNNMQDPLMQNALKKKPKLYEKIENLTKEKKEQLESLVMDMVKKLYEGYTVGYILYDGSKEYSRAFYSRDGINHRWSWGSEDIEDYAFIIKPDGTGLYYNFTKVKKGASTKAEDSFKCKKVYE